MPINHQLNLTGDQITALSERFVVASRSLTEFAHTMISATAALNRFNPFLIEWADADIRNRARVLAELISWGMPESWARWISLRLPTTVAWRFAEIIEHDEERL